MNFKSHSGHIMKIKLEVTQNDIDKGIPGNGYCCPIAISLSRHLNQNDLGVDPFVTDQSISYMNADTDCLSFTDYLPKLVQRFVKDFDSKREVEPFTTELEFT
jgi:hypothetical protein